MRIIRQVICSKCGKKQISGVAELYQSNLFWRTCEFCNRYGLYRVTRAKLTSVQDWMTALYQAMDFRFIEKALAKALFSKKEESNRPLL